MVAYYITEPYVAGAQLADLVSGSPNVSTTSNAFASVAAGDLIVFDYITNTPSIQNQSQYGMWALVQSKTDSNNIVLDRNSAYTTGSYDVAFKYVPCTASGRLGKYPLDTINNVKFSIAVPLEKVGLPGQTSRATLVMDLGGVIRTITITGTFSDTAANVATYLGNIDRLTHGWDYSSYYSAPQCSQNAHILTLPFLQMNNNNGMWYLVNLERFEYEIIVNSTAKSIAHYTLVVVERVGTY